MGSNNFTYFYFSRELEKKFIIELSKENCPEEVIAFIQEDDHRLELQQRYDEENTPYSFRHAQEKAYENPEKYEDPIFLIPSHYERAKQDYIKSETRRKCIEEIRSHLPELTPEQQKLYERVNYDRITQAEIAREDGVSRAALTNRFSKIERRLTKLCKKDL